MSLGSDPDGDPDRAADPPSPVPTLPERKNRHTGLIVGIAVAAVAILVGTGFLIFKLTESGDRVTVRIGTTEASADYWPILVNLAAENDIDIRPINFGDFTQPNPALAQGQLDLNLFQHLVFLANYNVSARQTLTPIGSTVINPLGIYSRRHASLADIPQGGQVAIPNDPTNQSRALLVLQGAGLITLRGGGTVLSTPADIDTAGSRVRVFPVSAQQTVTSLSSVDAAVVNNNFALDARLDPTTALYNDDPSDPAAEPYINVFVTREADQDNPTYRKIVELYHDPAVTAAVVNASQGTAVIVDRPPAELASILAGLGPR